MENKMTNEENSAEYDYKDKKWKKKGRGVSSGVYGLAFIGALVYYIQHAATFWAGVIGFFKALFWPVFLVYKLLEFLKM